MTLDECCDVAQALSNRTRMRILLLLTWSTEPLTYQVIATHLTEKPTTISFHLRELYDNDLVTREETGRYSYYKIRDSTIKAFTTYLTSVGESPGTEDDTQGDNNE